METPRPKAPFRGPGEPIIMGVCGSFHDAAAVLMRGGQIVSAIEEERLTREKHDGSAFPMNAVLRLLEDAGLRWDDVTCLAFGWSYDLYEGINSPGARFFAELHDAYAREGGVPEAQLARRDVFERNAARFNTQSIAAFLTRIGREMASDHSPQVMWVRHHLAHAASAYFCSGFDTPTLVVTFDGYGDVETTTIWRGEAGELTLIESIPIPHSLGWFYAGMTEYLGFRPLFAEGEVMGLAPYGAPRNAEEAALAEACDRLLCDLVKLEPNGRFSVDPKGYYLGVFGDPLKRVSKSLTDLMAPFVPHAPRTDGAIDPDTAADRERTVLAWCVQNRLEAAICHVVAHFRRVDPRTRDTQALALAGGVAYNVKANGRLIRDGLIASNRLFVQPAAGDAGAALGAAQWAAHSLGYSPAHKLTRVDLGPAYQHHEYEHALRTNGYERDAHYHEVGDETELIRQVAGRLSRGELVGWMHGGSEFGPRALGHRSILAGVTAPENDAKVNAAKHRQNWRPSAISIAVEAAPLIFSNFEADATAPFMTVAFDLTPAGAALIRAGVHHADASTRPQTVAKQDDPLFWQLLTEVGERTGLAALLNTSLNRREPLVESPEEALSAFQRMPELDSMILGRFVVTARPTAPEFVGEVSIAILKGGSGEVTTPFDRAMLDPAAQASRAVLLQTLQLEEGSADICLRVRCTASKYERRLRDLLIGDLTTRTRAAVTWR